jgi:lipoprotein signal peptidase
VIGIYFLVTGFIEFVFVTATIRTLAYIVPSNVIQMIPRLLGIVLMITGVVSFLLAWGLMTGKVWAWRAALIFVIVGAIANLLSFHLIGVVIDAIIVYYLTRPTVKQFFTKP